VPFARAVAYACLTVLKALFWFIGALLVLLTVVQHVRGDVDARPLVTLLTAAMFVGLGFISAFGASWFKRGGAGG
jgi:hypothetical protein